MSYQKIGFTSKMPLKAEHLNHLEDGIANAAGCKSWNGLEDKPFGEVLTECGDTLTWDGSPTETSVGGGEQIYYRVSDSTPTIDELIGCKVDIVGSYYTYDELTAEHFYQPNEDALVFVGNTDYEYHVWFGVTYADNVAVPYGYSTLTFPKKGIYFLSDTSYASSGHVESLTITNYNFTKCKLEKLDNKYISTDILEAARHKKVFYDMTSDYETWSDIRDLFYAGGGTIALKHDFTYDSKDITKTDVYIIMPYLLDLDGCTNFYVNATKIIQDEKGGPGKTLIGVTFDFNTIVPNDDTFETFSLATCNCMVYSGYFTLRMTKTPLELPED